MFMPVAILQPLSSPVGDVVIYTGPLQPIGQLHRVTPGSRQFIDAPQKSFLRWGRRRARGPMSEQVQCKARAASRKPRSKFHGAKISGRGPLPLFSDSVVICPVRANGVDISCVVLALVHLEKICFAPTLCEPAACTQPVPRVPVAACDCARVCGSHGKRYELLRPPTLASAALLADDPAERASAAGWKGGCLAQRFAATTYESRTTPWVQRALALSPARSMVAARPPTAKLQRVACSASSLRLAC